MTTRVGVLAEKGYPGKGRLRAVDAGAKGESGKMKRGTGRTLVECFGGHLLLH